MTIRHSLFYAAILYAASGRAVAQPTTPPADSGAVIRTETKVVLVDAVVTDKKGHYVHDLTAKDFRVWEDNKEQTVTSFSFEADPASPTNTQPRYIVLFFDNSTMDPATQVRAREAAAKFIETNAGPTRLMAIVNYGGSLQISQNFTSDPERLQGAVKGVKFASVPAGDSGMARLSRAASDFGVRDVVLALRSLAKNLAGVPGRKTLILFTSGFPVNADMLSEVTATIDACNKANVAIYPIDGRGLVAPGMDPGARPLGPRGAVEPSGPRFELASFRPGGMAFFSPPQVRPPVGSPPGSGGGGVRTPGSPGTNPTPPGRGGTNPPPSNPRPPGGGVTPPPSTGRGMVNNPYNSNRNLIPRFPEMGSPNQNVMYMLAEGTGGFVIVNTNDLLSGLEKIGKEQNEFYLLGYTPPHSEEGACHTLRVKVDHGDSVRARSGYCEVKSRDVLAQSPIEKVLENRVSAAKAGNVTASLQVPFFYTSPNVARVNVALEFPPDDMKFDKEKGKFHSVVNILGIAYRPDGSVGARFSDSQAFDFENKKEVEAFKEHPYHYENQFDVATGKYTLKVVFSMMGESFGKVEMPLTVDPYDGQRISVSALAFSTHTRKVTDAAGSLDAVLIEDRTPLIANGLQFIPSGSNRFKTTDKLVFYFEVYEPLLAATPDPAKPLAVALQARVLDKTGAQKFDSGLFRVPLPEKAGNPMLPVGLQVPMASLTPGSYRLELKAADTEGGSFKRLADFEIQ
jgi:VWFA-related protein